MRSDDMHGALMRVAYIKPTHDRNAVRVSVKHVATFQGRTIISTARRWQWLVPSFVQAGLHVRHGREWVGGFNYIITNGLRVVYLTNFHLPVTRCTPCVPL